MKKPISVLLSILIVFSALNALSFGVSAAESDDAAGSKTDILFGDVNGDGTVDFDDVLGINAIIGDESVSEETKIIADVNDDGAVTYADAVELKTALDNGDIYSLTIYDRLSDAGFCGKNGSNVKYIIKKDGKAIIFGSGAIKDSRISQIWLYSAEELIKLDRDQKRGFLPMRRIKQHYHTQRRNKHRAGSFFLVRFLGEHYRRRREHRIRQQRGL